MAVKKNRGKPNVVNAEEQVERAIEYQNWLDEGNKEGGVGDPSKVHGVKRRSILHNLPYWKVMVELHLHIMYVMMPFEWCMCSLCPLECTVVLNVTDERFTHGNAMSCTYDDYLLTSIV